MMFLQHKLNLRVKAVSDINYFQLHHLIRPDNWSFNDKLKYY